MFANTKAGLPMNKSVSMSQDFEAAGVIHRKFSMPGRELPSEDKVLE